MRLPFSSLRANLIAAFVAVIGLSLLLASGAFAYLLADYQAERERDRLQELAMYHTLTVTRALREGRSIQQIGPQLDQSAAESGVRVLLLDPGGTVVYDTEGDFNGRTFPIPSGSGRRPNVYQGTLSTPGGEIGRAHV